MYVYINWEHGCFSHTHHGPLLITVLSFRMILYVNGLNSCYRIVQQPSYKEKAWETHRYRHMHRTRTESFCFQLTECCLCLRTASWRRVGEWRKRSTHYSFRHYIRTIRESTRVGLDVVAKKKLLPQLVYIFKTIYERQLHEVKEIFSMDSRGLPLKFYFSMYTVISCTPLCRRSSRSENEFPWHNYATTWL
jgi:hypothetical protein